MWLQRILKNLRNRLQPNLQQDRHLLLFCMGLSLICWFLVKLSANYSTLKTFHPTYQIPTNQAFIEMPPDHLYATISGRGWDLMFEYFANFEPEVNIDVVNEDLSVLGQAQLQSAVEDALTSSQLKVVRLDLNQIPLKTEERDQKTIPIILIQNIETAAGYHLSDSIQLIPDSVLISGPASLVDSLDDWETLPLQLTDLQQTSEHTISLHPSPWSGLLVTPQQSKIVVPIEQLTEKSMFIDVVVKNAPDSMKIFPNKIRINATVGIKDFNAITQADFRAEVDLAGVELNDEKNTAPIIITQQPKAVTSIYFTPKSVEFFIVKETD
ncbi:MAG: CdaR family protein [Saprospiraceae bacterium]